jgi:hypothetical protein
MAKIVTGVFDGDIDGLFALMLDSSINGFIREVLFGAATFLSWERRIERDRLQGFLVRFYEERPAEGGDQAWAAGCKRSLLGLRDLAPLVDNAWRCPSGSSVALSSTMTLPRPNARPTTSIASRKPISAHRRRHRIAGLNTPNRRLIRRG